MISTKQAILLGLQPKEKKILHLLITNPKGLTVTAISALVKEPRTTVGFYLNKLLRKGWTKRAKDPLSRYPLWYATEKNEIKNTASGFFASLGISTTSVATVSASEGYEQIISAYEKILGAGKEERVFIIQGHRAPEATLKKLPTEFIEKIHNVQKQKLIILEGITGEKTMRLFETMSLRELRSHYGRLTVVYLIPDEYLDFDAEIFIFQNNIVVIQPATAKALIIRDQNTCQALRSIISFVETHARKVNVNEYIQKLIEKKEKAVKSTAR